MNTWNRNGIERMGRVLTVISIAAGMLAVRADDKEYESSKGGPASAQAGKSGDPQTCLKEGAKMNLAVIKVSQLASQKAENAELKRFAQKLEQDHQKSQEDLKQLAGKYNVTLPTEIDDRCKQEISKLEGLSGQEFDRAFAEGAVEGHAMAVAHLEQASGQIKDADLRQHTQKTLAQVKEHQRQARAIAKTVGVDQARITSLESKAHEGVGSPAATERSSSRDLQNKQ